MTEKLLSCLKCLRCGSTGFTLRVDERNDTEVRTGLVTCDACSAEYGIEKGIVGFLVDPPQEVLSEIEGKDAGRYEDGRLHDTASEEAILKMPYLHQEGVFGYYEGLAENFDRMVEKMELGPGVSILDVGASNCWSTNRFAAAGCYAVAVDISTVMFAGLESGDFFINKGAYFERVQGDMNNLPFQDGSFDYIFFNNALHHSSHIATVLSRTHRLLKTGGKLVLVGEPSCGIFSNREEFGREEREEQGINENIYTFCRYRREMQTAGFRKITFFFPPAIDMKLSTGKFGWKRVNTALFRLLHLLWTIPPVRAAGKKLLMLPAALLYNFQIHCIAEKK